MTAERFDPVAAPTDADHAADQALWFCVRRSEVLLVGDAGVVPSTRPDVDHDEAHFLGRLGRIPVWALEAPDDHEAPGDHRYLHLRQLYGVVPDQHWTLAGRAEQILTWNKTHRFCGRCGTPTERHGTERARTCPACGLQAFPRLTPAVIMAVTRDDQILLAHGRQFPGRFYSTLAGFVEPGETLEEAVGREVREEVGVEIGPPRYFGSQPWPFPHSLMIGFTAEWLAGEIAIQEDEIVDAGWFTPDDLPPCPIGGMSIAGALIADWLERSRQPTGGA